MTVDLHATARELLRDLVETPSVSGEEAACAGRLEKFFEEYGREAWVDEVGNVHAPAAESVLLTSHVDTVPGTVPVRIENETLWGRGSVDAKGPLAAMAAASVESGVSFVGVVREETDSAGARHLIENRDPPEAVINGEPSGWDAITLGYRGLLSGTYRVSTDAGHTSRPEPNAIQKALEWWRGVERSFADHRGPTVEGVTAKPIGISGGTSADGFSFEASIDVQFRIPTERTVEGLKAAVEPAGPGTIEWTDEIPPVLASPRNQVARALRRGVREEGGEPSHLRKTGTSDMNIFASAWDVPMATYGPGDSSLDHTPEERIDLGEFDRAVDVLVRASASL